MVNKKNIISFKNLNKKNIMSFIDFRFTPFSRKQCIIRLFIIWGFSIALCFIGGFSLLLACIIAFFDIVISVIFCTLMIKFHKAKASRFLCDGLFPFYVAIILNLSSYRIMTLQMNSNLLLAVFFLFLLFLVICLFILIVYFNLKSDKYSNDSQGNKLLFLPFACGTLGILTAKLFLQNVSTDFAIQLAAILLLILSLLTGAASVNILKFLLLKHLEKNQ